MEMPKFKTFNSIQRKIGWSSGSSCFRTTLFATAIRILSRAFCLLAAFTSLAFPSGAEEQKKPLLKVGLLLALSGPRASFGVEARNGAELALEFIRRQNSPIDIELIYEDTQADAAKAVTAFQHLRDEGIKVFVTQNSNVSMAIAPLANNYQVVQLGVLTTADRYSTPDDYTFRTNGSSADEAVALLKFATGKEGPFAIIAQQEEFHHNLATHVEEGLRQKAGTSVARIDYPGTESDFRPLLLKLIPQKPKAIFVFGYQQPVGLVVKQVAGSALAGVLIISSGVAHTPEFLTVAGKAAEGVFLSHGWVNDSHPAFQAFKERYQQEFVTLPAANGFDAVQLLQLAGEKCGPDLTADCVKKNLFAVTDYAGLAGRKGFDRNGDMKDYFEILTIRDGKFIRVDD